MKKVYLKGYFYFNLGDDLFIYLISKRYKNIEIATLTKFKYNINNVKFIDLNKFKILNKLIKIFSFNRKNVESYFIKNSDYSVLIGGSMFIEKQSNYTKELFSKHNKYFVLGANFGPYHTNKFYNDYFKIFENAQDVCFRDEYSYKLFEKLPNVRYAPDIVFSLKTDEIKMKDNDNAIISVIDASHRFDKKTSEDYINKIVELIDLLKNKNYNITLMSFCQKEGDEEAINEIINRTENKYDLKKYFYKGDISEALNIIGNSKIVVGTRFHANILGLTMNKTIIPIAYSDKTINTLRDIGFEGKIFDIRDMKNFDINSLTEKDLSYKCNVNKQREEAEKHFQELDKLLKRVE